MSPVNSRKIVKNLNAVLSMMNNRIFTRTETSKEEAKEKQTKTKATKEKKETTQKI